MYKHRKIQLCIYCVDGHFSKPIDKRKHSKVKDKFYHKIQTFSKSKNK